jgi:UDP-N-acetylglucosamine diphosphorylase / glucose-1-phosphate thymidylyltransferase / UDP-N-acetylgalactosamine diphosphorylase / glucosamine-1-phosphate N-acetyltransferase / galactosamine-1-phosphate N-acetyltransferase
VCTGGHDHAAKALLMPTPPRKTGASREETARFQPLCGAISAFAASPLSAWALLAPWEMTGQSEAIVRRLLDGIGLAEFNVTDEVAVHVSATVEHGAVLKGPLILGAGCFVAAGAYLRGGNWIAQRCVFGPGTELKSSFVFADTKLAHFNFVGDSILGTDVNLEAGSIICNFRNERTDKEIQVRSGDTLQRTGVQKFGAVVGDRCRIGANAVVAPGALLLPGTVVGRATLVDDEASATPVFTAG